LPDLVLHNWADQGTLDLGNALSASCNPAFYEIGLKLDRIDPMILPSWARRFGLGSVSGLGLGESAGTVPDPTWKQRQLRQPWSSGDAVNLAIGQGYLLATPLQMANAYAALGGDGLLRKPNLIDSTDTLGELRLQTTTREAILGAMRNVTQSALGTAYQAFRGSRFQVAAKTGSAENENPDAHAWFVGFSPMVNPRVLVLVMVEGGQQGSTTAAPIARQIFDFVLASSNRG
jgi:penicillin-binding protein 2